MKHSWNSTVLLAMIVALLALGQANAGRGGRPTASVRKVEPLDSVRKIATEPIDLKAVQAEDRRRESRGAPYRFAISRSVALDPFSDGTWEQIDDETWMWRLRISSPGAQSVNLGFTRFHMPEGGRLFVYSVDGQGVLGPFDHRDNEEHGELWTPVVLSDKIVVELTIAAKAMEELDLELTSINHGYRGFDKSGSVAKSGSCNVDVVCSEGDGWRDQIRSVGAYSTGGMVFCTGALINNTAQDETPYFLTAEHCSIDAGNAASMVVYWNYQRPECGVGSGSKLETQSGAYLRASSASSDFKLLELDDAPDPSFNVYFAGWDRSSTVPSNVTTIHHPDGDEKSISFDYDATCLSGWETWEENCGEGTDHIRVADWDVGTTEPASSGCPLFDSDKRIVGQLHGGYAACSNDEEDWFGRFYSSWTGGGTDSSRLSNWLDPLGTGAMTLDGKNRESGCILEFLSSDVPKTIPDPGTVVSTLTITQYVEIIDLNVKIDISHTFDGDLDVFLISPGETRIELFTDVGNSGNDFSNTILDDEAVTVISDGTAPFTGSYRPEGNLRNLDRMDVEGTWRLEVTDDDEQAAGTINGWSLIIEGYLAGDFEPDCDVDYNDLTFFTSRWLDSGCNGLAHDETDWCDGIDIDQSTRVNFIDYFALAENWLLGVSETKAYHRNVDD